MPGRLVLRTLHVRVLRLRCAGFHCAVAGKRSGNVVTTFDSSGQIADEQAVQSRAAPGCDLIDPSCTHGAHYVWHDDSAQAAKRPLVAELLTECMNLNIHEVSIFLLLSLANMARQQRRHRPPPPPPHTRAHAHTLWAESTRPRRCLLRGLCPPFASNRLLACRFTLQAFSETNRKTKRMGGREVPHYILACMKMVDFWCKYQPELKADTERFIPKLLWSRAVGTSASAALHPVFFCSRCIARPPRRPCRCNPELLACVQHGHSAPFRGVRVPTPPLSRQPSVTVCVRRGTAGVREVGFGDQVRFSMFASIIADLLITRLQSQPVLSDQDCTKVLFGSPESKEGSLAGVLPSIGTTYVATGRRPHICAMRMATPFGHPSRSLQAHSAATLCCVQRARGAGVLPRLPMIAGSPVPQHLRRYASIYKYMLEHPQRPCNCIQYVATASTLGVLKAKRAKVSQGD